MMEYKQYIQRSLDTAGKVMGWAADKLERVGAKAFSTLDRLMTKHIESDRALVEAKLSLIEERKHGLGMSMSQLRDRDMHVVIKDVVVKPKQEIAGIIIDPLKHVFDKAEELESVLNSTRQELSNGGLGAANREASQITAIWAETQELELKANVLRAEISQIDAPLVAVSQDVDRMLAARAAELYENYKVTGEIVPVLPTTGQIISDTLQSAIVIAERVTAQPNLQDEARAEYLKVQATEEARRLGIDLELYERIVGVRDVALPDGQQRIIRSAKEAILSSLLTDLAEKNRNYRSLVPDKAQRHALMRALQTVGRLARMDVGASTAAAVQEYIAKIQAELEERSEEAQSIAHIVEESLKSPVPKDVIRVIKEGSPIDLSIGNNPTWEALVGRVKAERDIHATITKQIETIDDETSRINTIANLIPGNIERIGQIDSELRSVNTQIDTVSRTTGADRERNLSLLNEERSRIIFEVEGIASDIMQMCLPEFESSDPLIKSAIEAEVEFSVEGSVVNNSIAQRVLAVYKKTGERFVTLEQNPGSANETTTYHVRGNGNKLTVRKVRMGEDGVAMAERLLSVVEQVPALDDSQRVEAAKGLLTHLLKALQKASEKRNATRGKLSLKQADYEKNMPFWNVVDTQYGLVVGDKEGAKEKAAKLATISLALKDVRLDGQTLEQITAAIAAKLNPPAP